MCGTAGTTLILRTTIFNNFTYFYSSVWAPDSFLCTVKQFHTMLIFNDGVCLISGSVAESDYKLWLTYLSYLHWQSLYSLLTVYVFHWLVDVYMNYLSILFLHVFRCVVLMHMHHSQFRLTHVRFMWSKIGRQLLHVTIHTHSFNIEFRICWFYRWRTRISTYGTSLTCDFIGATFRKTINGFFLIHMQPIRVQVS